MSEQNGLLDRVTRCEGVENEIIETIQAISQVVGQGEVQARLGAIKCDKMKKLVTDSVEAGRLEATDTVTADSLVVGQQVGQDGAPIFPGRFQVAVSDMVEDVRKALVGKKVGESLALPTGGGIRVDEVYVQGTGKATKLGKSKGKRVKKKNIVPVPPTPAPGN